MRRSMTLSLLAAGVLPVLGIAPGASARPDTGSRAAHARGHRSADVSRRRGRASSGRWIHINEVGRLHRVGKGSSGFKLDEKGYASGTIKGRMYIHLHVTAVNRATVKVSVYPRHGFIGGYAVARYYARGAKAHFSGKLRITGGSGSYEGAYGSGLSFSGTIKRVNDAATVRLSGRLHT